MPAPKLKAECSIKLCDQTLHLEFKSLNLMVLSDITGKTPVEFFSRFDGCDLTDLAVFARKVCDFSMLVPLVVAGLANDPKFEKTSVEALRKKVCKLLDGEAERSQKPLLRVVAEVAAKVLPAVVVSMNIDDGEDESPNGQAPEADAEGAKTNSVGDA